jgi:hypothetical protein
MSGKLSGGQAQAAQPEIVPSGYALSVVSRWLPPPVDGEEALLDGKPGAVDKPRPARLGLGADHLSHAKAAALLDPLQRRLERQLGATQARRLREGKTTGKRAAESEPAPPPEEEEVEEETRSGAFVRAPARTVMAAVKPLSRKARKRLRDGRL